MPNLGVTELLIVLLIVLLLFGATRIPQIMEGLGRGVHELGIAISEEPSKDEKQDKRG